jgi:hypothetical protein
MKNTPVSPMNKKKMSLNGSVYIVHLMEVLHIQGTFDKAGLAGIFFAGHCNCHFGEAALGSFL